MAGMKKWKVLANGGHEYFVEAHGVAIQDDWFSFFMGEQPEDWEIIATFNAPAAVLLVSELTTPAEFFGGDK